MKLEIKSVMHPFPHTIGPKQNLRQAIDMMKEHGFRHLPVKDTGRLVGILTERDIDFALRVEKKSPEEMSVSEAYIPDPYIVPPSTPVAQVAAKMAHEHIGSALVVDREQLVGIFTAVDACRVLSEVLSNRLEQ